MLYAFTLVMVDFFVRGLQEPADASILEESSILNCLCEEFGIQ